MMKTLVLSAILVSAGAMAQAATISLFRSGSEIAQISCGDAACEGWTGSGWSSNYADMFTVHPRAASEETWVSGISGQDFSGQSDKDETGATSAPTNSLAEYVLFKLGGGNTLQTALLRNVSGGAITYSFTQTGTAAGLSHTNVFGEISPVPVPASGVLLGLAMLGGGAFAVRRRRSA